MKVPASAPGANTERMRATRATAMAQAKLNLALRVLARDANGYHQLRTLFQRIDLADVVTVDVTTTARELDVRGMEVGPREGNLAWRAAVAFAAATGWPSGFHIELEKRIPAGGGLGGGSADAGGVLRALNALAPHPLASVDLAAIALSLGADVPFLTTEHVLAAAEGRGELIDPLPALPSRDVVLCFPPFGVSTASAFTWLAEWRGSAVSAERPARAEGLEGIGGVGLPAPAWDLEGLDWRRVATLAVNDLEAPVTSHHPELGESLAVLRAAGASIALMSGSGSTLFGIFDGRAPEALGGLPAQTRVVHSRTASHVAPVRLLD